MWQGEFEKGLIGHAALTNFLYDFNRASVRRPEAATIGAHRRPCHLAFIFRRTIGS